MKTPGSAGKYISAAYMSRRSETKQTLTLRFHCWLHVHTGLVLPASYGTITLDLESEDHKIFNSESPLCNLESDQLITIGFTSIIANEFHLGKHITTTNAVTSSTSITQLALQGWDRPRKGSAIIVSPGQFT